ncbi:MAG: hypothetical protein UIH27_09925, partial [Ruminococcus sp.]|nr:hypothetical protein [Ruminococcus sp.]
MKKTTKFISLLLAVLMVLSCFAGLTFASVTAAEEGQQIIYFEFPTDGSWGDPKQVNVNKSGLAMVYCYVYSVYGNEEPLTKYAFGAKKTMATPVNGMPADGNTLYSFDLSKYGTIENGASYGVIWSTTNPTTNKTYQTTDITMDYACLGDTVYVTESVPTRENSSDSDKKDFCAAWKNNKDNGIKGGITSLNNLLEGYFPTSMPKAKPLSDALKKYLTNPTNNPFFQWQQTETSQKKNGGWNEKTIQALGTTALDVYNQYMIDNAENIEGAEVIYPDGVKDKTPVPYISYEGYNDNAKLVTLKMAAPEAVAAVLNLEYPPAEPTTAHVHTAAAPVKENEVPATCKNAGSYDEVVKCSECGEELSRTTKTIAKLDHTPAAPVQENVVDATCKKAGSYDEVVKCSVCGEELSRTTKTIAKLDHTPGTPVQENVVEAECEKGGSYDEVTYCEACKDEIKREAKTTPALGHDTKSVAEVPATETAEGVKAHYECKRCGKLFSDAAGKNEVTAESLVIPVIEPTTEPAPELAYSIAGNNADIFGAEWDASNISTDMTKGDDGKYTITFTDVQPTDSVVEFKV